jgi:hypothetical protein
VGGGVGDRCQRGKRDGREELENGVGGGVGERCQRGMRDGREELENGVGAWRERRHISGRNERK